VLLYCCAACCRYVYLYDNTGAEIQVLDKHVDPNRLEFLRYHFLLASVGNAGYLKCAPRHTLHCTISGNVCVWGGGADVVSS